MASEPICTKCGNNDSYSYNTPPTAGFCGKCDAEIKYVMARIFHVHRPKEMHHASFGICPTCGSDAIYAKNREEFKRLNALAVSIVQDMKEKGELK